MWFFASILPEFLTTSECYQRRSNRWLANIAEDSKRCSDEFRRLPNAALMVWSVTSWHHLVACHLGFCSLQRSSFWKKLNLIFHLYMAIEQEVQNCKSWVWNSPVYVCDQLFLPTGLWNKYDTWKSACAQHILMLA